MYTSANPPISNRHSTKPRLTNWSFKRTETGWDLQTSVWFGLTNFGLKSSITDRCPPLPLLSVKQPIILQRCSGWKRKYTQTTPRMVHVDRSYKLSLPKYTVNKTEFLNQMSQQTSEDKHNDPNSIWKEKSKTGIWDQISAMSRPLPYLNDSNDHK